MGKPTQKRKVGHKSTKAPVAPSPVAQLKPRRDQPQAEPGKAWSALERALPALAFFLVYYLCLWKLVDVKLMYHGGGLVKDFPSFYWGWEFTRDFCTHPGGLVEYGSALLAQLMYSSWFGGLVLTLQAALAFAAMSANLRAFGARRLHLLGLIPPLLFLGVYSKYRHYSAPITSFVVGVIILWAWLAMSIRRPLLRRGTALVLAGCLYAAAPSGLIVFLPVAFLFELRSAEQTLGLLVWPCLCLLIPWLEGFALFGFARGEAYARILPLVWDPRVWTKQGAWIALLYLLPALLSLGAWISVLLAKQNQQAEALPEPLHGSQPTGRQSMHNAKQFSSPAASNSSIAGWTWPTAVCAAAPLAMVWLAFNAQTKTVLTLDYLAWHGQWPEVLAAGNASSRNPFVTCALTQASYHTGTLTRELPPVLSPLDLLLSGDRPGSTWKKSDLYFDLGYVNMALHQLTESVEFFGERPVLLQRLALVNLALGNISTAKVYLGTLARAPFQRDWARHYLERVQQDPTLADDEEIGRLRRFMVRRDSVLALAPDEELLQLLAANPQNRMAFEYLMTYYLLNKNLNAFVKNISRVKDFPGFEITPLWDEALVLAGRQMGRSVEVSGHTISQEALNRVSGVTRLVQQYGDKGELPRSEFSSEYARTYSFYWCFHQ